MHRTSTSSLSTVTLRLLLAACVASMAAPAAAQDNDEPTITLIAGPGDGADGLDRQHEFVPSPDREQMAINAAGQVLFNGQVSQSSDGAFVGDALLFGTARSFERVVSTTGPVPSSPVDLTGFTIQNFATRWLSPNGSVVVELFLRNGTASREAYFTWIDKNLAIGAVVGQRSPTNCDLADLGNGIEGQSFGLNGDSLVFLGIESAFNCPDPERAIYRRTPPSADITIARGGEGTGLIADSRWEGLFRQPAVSADGSVLFPARIEIDQGGTHQMLILSSPTGQLQILSDGRGKAPGTTLDHVVLENWSFGPPEETGRMVYTVNGGDESGIVASQTDHLVYDTTQLGGVAPVVRTGDTHGRFTFAAQPGAFQRTLFTHPARDKRIVLIGRTESSSPDDLFRTDSQGVWRYDPVADPPLQLVMYEGQFVTDRSGASRRVTSLESVDVNEHGAIACEVQLDGSSSNQAILLERRDMPGTFVVALQRRDDVPTDQGLREMSGLFGQLHNFPVSTGPGFSGRCGRFNAQYQYLFSGTVVYDGNQRLQTLFTITIEEPPKLNDVKVKVTRGNLDIRGSNDGCRIEIMGDGNAGFIIRPGENTSINGQPTGFDGEAVKNVKIRMGSGDDRVTFTSSDVAGDQNSGDDVLRNLTIDMGGGADTLIMQDVQVRGSTKIATGKGAVEKVDIDDCEFVRNLDIRGGDGQCLFDVDASATIGRTSIRLGNGAQSRLTMVAGVFHTTSLFGGTEADTISVRDTAFSGRLVIDPGRDILDNLSLSRNVHEAGGLVINAKKCEAVQIYSEDLEIEENGLRLITGKRGCNATFIRAMVNGPTNIKTTGSLADTRNEISLENSFFEEFKLIGKGSHTLSASDGAMFFGMAIKTKKGILDTLSFTRQEFGEGTIKIQAKPTGRAEVRFRDCDVENGDIVIKCGKGGDQVLIEGGQLNSDVVVKTGPGDDEIIMNSFAADNVTADGGPGTDIDRVDDDLSITGTLTQKNLE